MRVCEGLSGEKMMKHIIIGTAGHVNHGKTALIEALTGRNTDRLAEEKRRGMTIELGFTWMDLPVVHARRNSAAQLAVDAPDSLKFNSQGNSQGNSKGNCHSEVLRAGIIDVPGHEKFVSHMVAGVAGMDMVLLVIAADEGVMPQTKEHMDILELLGVQHCIVVMTKCDLVDSEWLDFAEASVRDELEDTIFENAPVIRVSSVTGEGLEALKQTITQMALQDIPVRDCQGMPRLPIDRVFTIKGFGTVVTGTLLSGVIDIGDILCVYPMTMPCRVRGIQVHGDDVGQAIAGQRVALNLPDVKKEDIYRGCVIAPKQCICPTRFIDVLMNILKDSKRILKNQMRLHLYTGTSEVLCRAVLLEQEELRAGEQGIVQLRLESPVAVRRGDRFVVRFYSPVETIGGGIIIDAYPRRRRRFCQETIDELKEKASGRQFSEIEHQVQRFAETMVTVHELAKAMFQCESQVEQAVQQLAAEGVLRLYPVKKDVYVWTTDTACAAWKTVQQTLNTFHQNNPYKYGMQLEEIHRTCFKKMKINVFTKLVETFIMEKKLKCVDDSTESKIALSEFDIVRDETFVRMYDAILQRICAAKYDFVRISEEDFKWETALKNNVQEEKNIQNKDYRFCSDSEKIKKQQKKTVQINLKNDRQNRFSEELKEDVLQVLIHEGKAIMLTEDIVAYVPYIKDACRIISQLLEQQKTITIIQLKEVFQTSRKNIKLLLSYTDSIKLTVCSGAQSEWQAYLK